MATFTAARPYISEFCFFEYSFVLALLRSVLILNGVSECDIHV